MNTQEATELQKKAELGHKFQDFLSGDVWPLIKKDYIDESVLGLKDLHSIKTNTAEACLAEIIGRQMAENYLRGMEVFIQGFIDEGKFALDQLKKLGSETDYIVRK